MFSDWNLFGCPGFLSGTEVGGKVFGQNGHDHQQQECSKEPDKIHCGLRLGCALDGVMVSSGGCLFLRGLPRPGCARLLSRHKIAQHYSYRSHYLKMRPRGGVAQGRSVGGIEGLRLGGAKERTLPPFFRRPGILRGTEPEMSSICTV